MILVEVTAAVNEAGAPQIFYLSTHGFVTAPSDTPANTAFQPVLRDAGSIGVAIFADGMTSGTSKLQPGTLKLVNVDSQFDAWRTYGFDGRPVVIRQGKGGAYPADFPIIFTGTVDGAPDCTVDAVEIRLRDMAYVLDQPVLTDKFAGTNVGPVGLEGTADDLKGRVKPMAYGKVLNISPPPANTSKQIYEASNGALAAISNVYVKGRAWTFAANYATSALLAAASMTPESATYSTCLAEGLFRLSDDPGGEVTADVAAASDAGSTVAQVLNALATAAGVTTVNADDVTLLDFLTLRPDDSPRPVGIWLSDEMTYRDAMDAVAASAGAWWAFDPVGNLRMGRLDAPVAGSDGDIIESEVLKGFERRNPDGSGIPVWRVTLRYRRNNTVQTTDLAGEVSAARRAFLAQEYRSVVAEAPSVKVKHLQARELIIDTCLVEEADAQAEADRLLALHCVARDIFDVPVNVAVFTACQARLAGQTNLTHRRFDLAAGKDLIVLGFDLELARERATLSLWG